MEAKDWVCGRCKHFRTISGGCDAFPLNENGSGGIPEVITIGENRHSEPLKGQKNKIVFEPYTNIEETFN